MMLTILLNATAIHKGGGRTDFVNLLRWLPCSRPEKIVALVDKDAGYSRYDLPSELSLIEVKIGRFRPLRRLYHDNVLVRRLIQEYSVETVVNLGGTGPLFLKSVRILTMIRGPFLVYPWTYLLNANIGRVWAVLALRIYVRLLLRSTTGVVVQTETMGARLQETYNYDGPLFVVGKVSEYTGSVRTGLLDEVKKRMEEGKSRFWFAYLTRYYPHKNIEVAVNAIRWLRDNSKWEPGLIVSLTPEEVGGNEGLAVMLGDGTSGVGVPGILNVGRLCGAEVEEVLRLADAVVSTSKLESLSGVYLDAMRFGLPLVASDRDFARSVCGDGAIYVDPSDPMDVARGMLAVLKNGALARQLAGRGSARYQDRFGGKAVWLERWHAVLDSD